MWNMSQRLCNSRESQAAQGNQAWRRQVCSFFNTIALVGIYFFGIFFTGFSIIIKNPALLIRKSSWFYFWMWFIVTSKRRKIKGRESTARSISSILFRSFTFDFSLFFLNPAFPCLDMIVISVTMLPPQSSIWRNTKNAFT